MLYECRLCAKCTFRFSVRISETTSGYVTEICMYNMNRCKEREKEFYITFNVLFFPCDIQRTPQAQLRFSKCYFDMFVHRSTRTVLCLVARLSGKRGVRSAECGVWKMRSVENAECRKCGVWKMRSVENAECRKCGVWKMRSVKEKYIKRL